MQAGKVVYAGTVSHDTVSGDVIKVGNISNSAGVAIGRGASAVVTSGITGPELDRLFGPLVEAARALRNGKRDDAVQVAEELKAEVAKGKNADDGRMGKLIDGFIGLAPGAVSVVVAAFGSPILAGIIGPVTKFVLDRIQGK